jgi:glycosyltransferase involved in cell wall biosynthesis
VHVLVDAVRGLPAGSYDARVFGSLETAPEYVTTLRRQAVGLPVMFKGAFDVSRVAEVFADIDVCVIPSLWPENAPLTIQEASIAGVPILGARMGGIPEFVTDGVNGRLFDPRRPAELTAILQDLIEHPDELTRLAGRHTPVRAIDDDARQWETRYRLVVSRTAAVGRAS